MTHEIWRPIEGFPGYEVSDLGRVKSFAQGKTAGYILRPCPLRRGHLIAVLYRDSQRHPRLVHRLVLRAFSGPGWEGAVTRHLNGDPADNRLSNLAWGTVSENGHDAVRHGVHPNARKTHCPRGHSFSDPEHVRIQPRKRACRTCQNELRRQSRQLAKDANR